MRYVSRQIFSRAAQQTSQRMIKKMKCARATVSQTVRLIAHAQG